MVPQDGEGLSGYEHPVLCTCGHDRFRQEYKIKKESGLVRKDGQDTIKVSVVFVCTKCETQLSSHDIASGGK